MSNENESPLPLIAFSAAPIGEPHRPAVAYVTVTLPFSSLDRARRSAHQFAERYIDATVTIRSIAGETAGETIAVSETVDGQMPRPSICTVPGSAS